MNRLPDPNTVFPNEYHTSCFIKNVVKAPNISIGDYTYYDDAEDPAAVLHSCAGAAETVVFGMESGQTPADDLRAAAEEEGYQGAVIGE